MASCTCCRNAKVKVFRRGVCRTCYRKQGKGSGFLASRNKQAGGVPDGTRRNPTAKNRNPDAMAEGMRLLAEGYSPIAVAKKLGVNRCTVFEWRDTPDGQRVLAEARKARESAFRDSVQDARRILQQAATKAADVLAQDLESRDPDVRSKAARTILDRTGLPRTERIEALTVSLVDVSVFSNEQLDQLESLQAMALRRKAEN